MQRGKMEIEEGIGIGLDGKEQKQLKERLWTGISKGVGKEVGLI